MDYPEVQFMGRSDSKIALEKCTKLVYHLNRSCVIWLMFLPLPCLRVRPGRFQWLKQPNPCWCSSPGPPATSVDGLVPRLLQAGYRVRCFVRDPERLQGRPWLDQVEVVAGDVLQAETLTRGHGRHQRGLLSDSQHGGRPGLPRTRPDRGAQLRRGRGGCRRRAHHLYGRPGRPRNGTLGASAFAPGYRRRAARGRRAGHGVSRRRHRRFGQPVVRADPLSDRTPAGDDLPALALHLHPAHRHPQRVGVSDCRAGDAGKHRGDHRDRRRGCADLRRHDARLCQGARPDAPAHSGARADPAPLLLLGAPGHADSGRDRGAVDRRSAQ